MWKAKLVFSLSLFPAVAQWMTEQLEVGTVCRDYHCTFVLIMAVKLALLKYIDEMRVLKAISVSSGYSSLTFIQREVSDSFNTHLQSFIGWLSVLTIYPPYGYLDHLSEG